MPRYIDNQARQILPTSANHPMPSPTSPSPVHPISSLPYEILLEIFIHCLPRYPLLQQQPSTASAPILLCHVCSSWRRLAQASPALWTHLSYEFPVVAIHGTSFGPAFWTYEFDERDIEFVRWWKAKQGGIPPRLAFKVGEIDRGDGSPKPATSDAAFLFEYLTAAQYLELDMFFWDWIIAKLLTGHPIDFPSVHTVLAEGDPTMNGIHAFYQLQTLLTPSSSLPALRRLSLTEWSALTHLSLHASVSLLSWLPLIRAVPRLRWGHFNLTLVTPPFDIPHGTPHPPQCTIAALTTLSIVIRSTLERSAVFPLSALFTALHLPAVHTLALATPGARVWEDRRAVRELCTVLASAPAVTELSLEDPLDTIAPSDAALEMPPTALPTLPDVEHPIWQHAPALARLHLALPARLALRVAERDTFLALFVSHVFGAECAWLDLRNPACPVRVVEISNGAPFFHRTGEAAMARVRASAAGAPGVVLELSAGLVGPSAEARGSRRGTPRVTVRDGGKKFVVTHHNLESPPTGLFLSLHPLPPDWRAPLTLFSSSPKISVLCCLSTSLEPLLTPSARDEARLLRRTHETEKCRAFDADVVGLTRLRRLGIISMDDEALGTGKLAVFQLGLDPLLTPANGDNRTTSLRHASIPCQPQNRFAVANTMSSPLPAVTDTRDRHPND
ncbi:hypothetical protein BJ912DRAFT_1062363 [Pholiota molesta]|nr:hypothetical protein BJ912DRAFT_1062363 [Pholiota molesta]